MKEVIKLLEEAERNITPLMGMDRDFCKMAASCIHDAIKLLKKFMFLTPAEWEIVYEEPLRDDAMVWVLLDNGWTAGRYIDAKVISWRPTVVSNGPYAPPEDYYG
ncbi:hypothetical protein FACS189461_1490 [Spirochaetia bacterium]|nr:hypothetical protein FACS189461_1490 [Spirochaetia bacterium]